MPDVTLLGAVPIVPSYTLQVDTFAISRLGFNLKVTGGKVVVVVSVPEDKQGV